MTDHTDEIGAEVAVYTPPRAGTVDLRERATDSWTDVVAETSRLAEMIAGTEFVPASLRGSAAKVTAAILYGRELGLPPMTGLGATHVIEGKAGISAEMMRALVLQAGHELQVVESSRTVCTIRGRRKGGAEWTTATWTIAEAQQTQVFLSKEKGWGPLAAKAQWRSWPADMLLARATTRLVRMIFPDVAHGMRSVEELEDLSEVVEGAVVDAPPPAAEPVKRQRVKPTVKAPADVVDAAADVVDVEPTEPVETAEVKPVQRRRVDPPAPREHPSAPVENRAVVDELDDEPPAVEVVDAEVVDAEPAGMTEEQRKAVAAAKPEAFRKAVVVAVMQFERLGVTDRTERLWYTSVIIGREITSTNELALEEVRHLVNQLERAKSIDAINALIDKGNPND